MPEDLESETGITWDSPLFVTFFSMFLIRTELHSADVPVNLSDLFL
jgi:hypothetical protein